MYAAVKQMTVAAAAVVAVVVYVCTGTGTAGTGTWYGTSTKEHTGTYVFHNLTIIIQVIV